jgi:hypothetical protein
MHVRLDADGVQWRVALDQRLHQLLEGGAEVVVVIQQERLRVRLFCPLQGLQHDGGCSVAGDPLADAVVEVLRDGRLVDDIPAVN